MKFEKLLKRLGLMCLCLIPIVVCAETSVSVTGFIRQEASTLTGDANVYNQATGNVFNNVPVTNFFGNTITRVGEQSDHSTPLIATRAEIDFKFRFSDSWEGFAKIRGFYEHRLDDEFEDNEYFISGFDDDNGSILETNGEDYMIDIPALYLDYNNGPFWLRMGNQQIAWGDAIFFRIFDVVNGLDLRRHSFLDVAAEEYSDKRVPSLGIRGSYRFENDWELEGFVQQFRPTVLAPLDTPYNFVASQFVVRQEEGWDSVDDKYNYGLRLTGRAGDFDLSFLAVQRYNPDGTFRWTESDVNPFAGIGVPALEGLGQLLANTAFEINPAGVWSGEEWLHYAGLARLHGIDGLTASVLEFPAAQALGAFPITPEICASIGVPDLTTCTVLELDAFFDPLSGGLGPLKGHIAREYHKEEIFGVGMTYVFNGEPDTLLDQLIFRVEATMAMDRKFTNISLSRDYIEEDELVTNVSLEKYHRFSANFPATYLIFQWMHKSESDFLGRHLSGMGSDRGPPKGDSNFNAFAFALQQPFPGLIWRADLAVLYDANGGYLIQPGVRWRPRDNIQLDVYANIIGSDGDNDDVMETFEDMDEVFARFTYYF